MKRQSSMWQITFPVCGVLIFLIGALTAVQMINGRYLFHFEITPQGMKVITDVDKRDGGNDSVQETKVDVQDEVKEEEKSAVFE